MKRKLALKRLTASDLTFFEYHFRNHKAGNQKAINLNADIFVKKLYPNLPNIAAQTDGRLPLDLYIYGPGIRGPYNIQRKIVKLGSYKNWRLNGEFVYNPEDDPERFNLLQPNDLAIFEFVGEICPKEANLVLVANSIVEDRALHTALNELLNNRSMMILTSEELSNVLSNISLNENHPVYELVDDEDVEDAAFMGVKGVERLLKKASIRRLTQAKFERARKNAEQVGTLGEQLLNSYLEKLQSTGGIISFEWVSQSNAISPYDFSLVLPDNSERLVDAKSTTGEFNRSIHISFTELRQMSTGDQSYDLYRLYEVGESRAKLRIARDMKSWATGVLDALNNLPVGVSVDSISVSPEILPFDDEEIIIDMEEDIAASE